MKNILLRSARITNQRLILFFVVTLAHLDICLAAGHELNVEEEKASVEHDCAPWDGLAFTIWIPTTEPNGKSQGWIRISIWQTPEVSGRSFTFPDTSQRIGTATYWPQLKSRAQVILSQHVHEDLAGKLHFTRLNDRDSALGEFEFVTGSNTHLAGRFEAAWARRVIECG